MRLVVGTNFDDKLIEEASRYPVKYLYGSHRATLTGHGRVSFVVPDVNDERLREHISLAHSKGIKFLYTMNSPSYGGLEYSDAFWSRLKAELEKLVNLGIDGVIVATPLLLEYVKKEHPELEVSISSFARISNIREVENYIELGADTIILHEDDNRKFDLLSSVVKLAKKRGVDVEVITNNSCLWGCAYRRHHDVETGELSRETAPKGVWFEYPLMFCATDVRNDFANLIRMRWIRPEDLHYYEEIGIDRFKIASRNKRTEWILRAIKAYSERKYEGNLLDIVSYPQGRAAPYALAKLGAEQEYQVLTKVYVDNTKFPSKWLEFFKTNDCDTRPCSECKYCDVVAEKVISVDGKPLSEVKLPKIRAPIELIPRFVSDGAAH
jgi:collagenase-like PrtC family protease